MVNLIGYLWAAQILAPEDFGWFAIHVAISSPISALATGRYETTFITAFKRSRVVNLLCVAILLVALSTIISSLILVSVDSYFEFDINIYYIIMMMIFQSLLNVISQLNNYTRMYAVISSSRFIGAVVTQAILLSLLYTYPTHSLNVSFIAGLVCAVVVSVWFQRNWLNTTWHHVSVHRMIAVAKRYVSYILYTGPQALASVFQEPAAIATITALFGAPAAGLYSFANRLMRAPISIVAESVGRVLQRQFADTVRDAGANRRATIRSYISALCVVGVLVGVLAWTLLTPAVGLIFNEHWQGLGGLLRASVPYYASYLVVASLVSLPLVTGNPQATAALGTFGSALYVASLAMGGSLGGNLEQTFIGVSVVMTGYFIGMVWVIYRSVIKGRLHA